MENKKYVVSRENVYVGRVVKAYDVFRNRVYPLNSGLGKITTSSWINYRGILFIPTIDNKANDLLYDSPAYPIFNLTSDKICLSLSSKTTVVKTFCSLASLLEYYKFPEYLTYEDVVKIRHEFFEKNFAVTNSHLFGYSKVEFDSDDETSWFFKNHSFPEIIDSNYYNEWNELSKSSHCGILDRICICDAFTPPRCEKRVRKLQK